MKTIIRSIGILTISLFFVVNVNSSLAQCHQVDLTNVKLQTDYSLRWLVVDLTNQWQFEFYGKSLNEEKIHAQNFLSLLQAYKVRTFCPSGQGLSSLPFGHPNQQRLLMFTDDGKPIKGNLVPGESCVHFNRNALKVFYSASYQAELLTDGKTVLAQSSDSKPNVDELLSAIQKYDVDTYCNGALGEFSYFKQEIGAEKVFSMQTSGADGPKAVDQTATNHVDEQTATVAKSPDKSTTSPRTGTDGLKTDSQNPAAAYPSTRNSFATISKGTAIDTSRLGALIGSIDAKAYKWPPNPHDPIIREISERLSVLRAESNGIQSRARSSNNQQSIKASAELQASVNDLSLAVNNFMKARYAKSGSESLKQIAAALNAIKARRIPQRYADSERERD